MQFRFRTRLQSEIEFLSVADNLLHHRAHLVDLNRIDNKVLRLITVFFGCLFKAGRHLFNTIIQNIRKTHQRGSRYISTRCNNNMTFVINTKVRGSPTCNVVEFLRIFNTPLSHFSVIQCF